jgi:hypothetical protein
VTILGDIADLIRAATELIREVRPKHPMAPLKRSHDLAAFAGAPVMDLNAPVIKEPHCLYCGKLAPIDPTENCPYFT